MARCVNVLAIDGGGIRGLIPAIIPAHIERQTSKRVCELFDLIAGTSTETAAGSCRGFPSSPGFR